MPSQQGPTRRSALTALVWAYNNGILDEIIPKFLSPGHRPVDLFGKQESIRIDELEESLALDSERFIFAEDLIEEVAACLREDPYLYDPYHLAESLDGHCRRRARILNRDDNSIYLENFKYERALNSVLRPFIPIVDFLLDPQLYPFVNHFQFRYLVWKQLASVAYRPISYLLDGIYADGHFVTEQFLTTYLRNHPDFLLLEVNGKRCAGITFRVLPHWLFAAELIPDDQYIRIAGNAWRDHVGYDEIRYEVDPAVLGRFFSFHRVKDVFDLVEPVELAIKLRFHRRRRLTTVQNIPENTYEFIVRWIRENGSMWLTRRSRSLLGYTFEFDPSEIPPGKLLVYGGGRRFLKRGDTALVLSEMVSEGRQERGKIHPSRVASTKKAYKFEPTARQIDSLLSSDSCYESHGVLDIRRTARKLLLLLQIPVGPYYEKRAVKTISRHVSKFLEPVGKDLYVVEELCGEFEDQMPLAIRRKSVLAQMFPGFGSLYELLDSVPQDVAQVVERLAH